MLHARRRRCNFNVLKMHVYCSNLGKLIKKKHCLQKLLASLNCGPPRLPALRGCFGFLKALLKLPDASD